MRTINLILISTWLIVGVAGCSHIKKIGTIGDVTYYKVSAASLIGPTINTLVTIPVGATNNPKIIQSFAGNGIGPTVVGAGGIVGAAATFGVSRRPDSTAVTVNQGGSSANSSSTATPMNQMRPIVD